MLATTAKSSIITLTQRPAAFTPAPLTAPGTEAAATLTTLPPSDSRNVAHSLGALSPIFSSALPFISMGWLSVDLLEVLD